jgi:thymidylate synthase (FAD)
VALNLDHRLEEDGSLLENKALIGKRVNVLDKGWVELQDIMGDDLAIVNAARVSFLGESKGSERDKKLLFYLLRHRHTSPFEQVEFKFRVRAPVLVWWQWARHRMWHYNAQSGRYTPFQEDDFYVPVTWRKQAKDNKQGSDGTLEPAEAEALTVEMLAHYEHGFALYQKALAAGVAKEQARLFLPGFSVYYTWVAKTDAHNLMHFLSLRMAGDAQEEIRMYAQAIYEQFFCQALPWTAEAFEKYILKREENA